MEFEVETTGQAPPSLGGGLKTVRFSLEGAPLGPRRFVIGIYHRQQSKVRQGEGG